MTDLALLPTDARAAYRVLARKHRPARFADLIGQQAMVRTLSNAIASGRLAHAFVLTGVRGVGKTTTARIIARALNCVGPDGKGGPTIDPCGQCEHCRAIAEDRHMDVIEMDAASRTGVDDIRELIDGVRYRPVSARFKIYILDEVHMLSTKAFNALLKTLEEPPEHVKFIFATTEIRKVPITILSRCQRFDLSRVGREELAAHLSAIATKEGVSLSEGAAAVIARAADGSVRDGLSLLDRAIAHAEGEVTEAAMRELLGLADRTEIFDLFEAVLSGEAAAALGRLDALYNAGADPAVVVQDLLELVHWLTRVKVAPEIARDPGVPEAERERGRAFAEKLSMPALARAWQILLKGLSEVQTAPSGIAAAEMLLVRLAYAADLPTPAELVAALAVEAPAAPAPEAPPARGGAPRAVATTTAEAPRPAAARSPAGGSRTQAALAEPAAPAATPARAEPASLADPRSFAEVVALFAQRREGAMQAHLYNNVHLVGFERGRIELRPTEHAPRDLATRMSELLSRWTGRSWVVALSREAGQPTLAEQEAADLAARKLEAGAHPLVRAVLDAFPGATIEAVRGGAAAPAAETETEREAPLEFTDADAAAGGDQEDSE